MKGYIGGLLFALGLGAGGAAGWYFTRQKEQERANFEIEQVQAYYKRLNAKKEEEAKKSEAKNSEEISKDYISTEEAAVANREKPSITEFKPRTSTNEDVRYSKYYAPKLAEVQDEPYLISEKEADEFEDYNNIGLYYFTDGNVSEEDGSLIDDIPATCGTRFKMHFAENPDLDSIWVRNDRLKSNYEIMRSAYTYDEFMKKYPKQVKIE